MVWRWLGVENLLGLAGNTDFDGPYPRVFSGKFCLTLVIAFGHYTTSISNSCLRPMVSEDPYQMNNSFQGQMSQMSQMGPNGPMGQMNQSQLSQAASQMRMTPFFSRFHTSVQNFTP